MICGAVGGRVLEGLADLLEVEHAHLVVLAECRKPVGPSERGLSFRGLQLLCKKPLKGEVKVVLLRTQVLC